jgi:glycosyltransferase involved in cell wall biosynthesis
MKNILIVVQEYFPKDVRVFKEYLALQQLGIKFTIICLKGKDEKVIEQTENAIIYRIGINKSRGSVFRYIYEYAYFFLKTFFLVFKLTKKNFFDIAHVHTLPDFLVFSVLPAKRKGTKIFLDMHEIMPEFYASKFNIDPKNFKIKILKWVERKSIEFADEVITVNHSLKKVFEQRTKPKQPLTVIMNTVNETNLKLPKKTKSTNSFKAIYHGTLTPLYNLGFVINELSKIKDKLINLGLIFEVYGAGPMERVWIEQAQKLDMQGIIKFNGVIPYKEIPKKLANAQLGILPLVKDVMTNLSFSNKFAEYIFAEIPVLSTNLDSYFHYFDDRCVNYFDIKKEGDFSKKLLFCLENQKEIAEKAVLAKSKYQEIEWGMMEKKLLSLYTKYISAKDKMEK